MPVLEFRPRDATDEGRHLATHITLTMATEEEVQEAMKAKITQLEGIDVTNLTDKKRFIYAEKSAPLALDIKLNVRLPLPKYSFEYNPKLCKNSSISFRNREKSDPTFFRSNVRFFDVAMQNFERSEPDIPRLFIRDMWPSGESIPDIETEYLIDDKIGKIYIDAHPAADTGYVLANSQKRYALFKVKLDSKDERPCGVDCVPCNLRSQRKERVAVAHYSIVAVTPDEISSLTARFSSMEARVSNHC